MWLKWIFKGIWCIKIGTKEIDISMTAGSYVEIWYKGCSNSVNFKQVVAKFMILAFLIGKF
jgi:hypothetical protein